MQIICFQNVRVDTRSFLNMSFKMRVKKSPTGMELLDNLSLQKVDGICLWLT